MDEAEAASQSPVNNPPATDAPQLVVCGGDETPEFHRQSDCYADKFATATCVMERYTAPNRDHVNVTDDLADPTSHLFQKALRLMQA